MNPRRRQYALGGALDSWVMLDRVVAPVRRRLVTAYRGWNPWVYSRYGRRQWAGPLPWTRIIMKDPFALLSLAAVSASTAAQPVLLYRHPAAVLASYRRMGWRADLAELGPIVEECRGRGLPVDEVPTPGEVDDTAAMAHFWKGLHQVALANAAEVNGLTVVAHEEVASGGMHMGRRLFDRLDLSWHQRAATELTKDSDGSVQEATLHNFDRSPASVAQAWRGLLSSAEVETVEEIAGETLARLDRVRFTASGR